MTKVLDNEYAEQLLDSATAIREAIELGLDTVEIVACVKEYANLFARYSLKRVETDLFRENMFTAARAVAQRSELLAEYAVAAE